MNFREDGIIRMIGKGIGFLMAYLLFTGLLFALLTLTQRLPSGWNLLHISIITLAIALFGGLIKRVLK